ncbi:DUF2933 domain-containing protein [Neorhizobium galegae]|uniref:DUF2933 domain-containing protein n=1 Tax=Neorhizobium galegae TaxID=399 RepID=UPI00062188F5|nr:DUF2933 domain-containing protein [Neorhizobium galegae]CDZ30792.1 Hypothetical protein NGAL_HAMBI490_56640 [Neorhizobium galegae bv. officinalis]KAB1115576.1 DUF2933 domain-containing protein [Neorhizobium galegae]MCM2499623.1 DUF2933 domain-containing protein [Neorhizobium galegae]MCQ1765906.1 DUF2933 domain-containing protein [Neorhizobium galegae]
MNLSRTGLLMAASLIIVIAFFILREHWAHALGLAPYLLLLACPLMHLFHGHGGHDHKDRSD